MTTTRIDLPMDQIVAFCRKWQIVEFALFGSVLRDDFRPDSDVDVMVSFAPGERWTFADLLDMENELKGILGRDVDLVERRVIERDRNYILRRQILSSAEPVYAAG